MPLYPPPEAATSTYVAYGTSEAESSTTSGTFVQKLRVTTPSLTSGTRYKFEWYIEIGATADNDAEVQFTVGGTVYGQPYFKNYPYATRYNSGSGGLVVLDTVSGAINVDLDFRIAYGTTAYVRRARILVTVLP